MDNFFQNDPMSRKRCRQAKSSFFSGRWSKTQNGDQNRIYPSLTSSDCKMGAKCLKGFLKMTYSKHRLWTLHRNNKDSRYSLQCCTALSTHTLPQGALPWCNVGCGYWSSISVITDRAPSPDNIKRAICSRITASVESQHQ